MDAEKEEKILACLESRMVRTIRRLVEYFGISYDEACACLTKYNHRKKRHSPAPHFPPGYTGLPPEKIQQLEQSWIDLVNKKYINGSDEINRKNWKRNNALNRSGRVSKEETSELTDDEKNDIREFYVECPQGMSVDHIIPLSRGGRHHLSNLQYLRPSENKSKGSKILTNKDLPPHCLVG